jgi:dTDP-4-dehydrorhamnose reductase
MSKIILFGSKGHLGTKLASKLKERSITLLTPDRKIIDLADFDKLKKYIDDVKPDVIINTASYPLIPTNESTYSKEYIENLLSSNIQVVLNIARICMNMNIKLIHFSTEYVFYGDEGNYNTDSALYPKNKYGLSKGSGEFIVRMLENSLIIRCPFIREDIFTHPKAFIDQFTSRQYIFQIVDEVCDACLSSECGVKHIVGERRNLFMIAKETREDIEFTVMPENLKKFIPVDSSLSKNTFEI